MGIDKKPNAPTTSTSSSASGAGRSTSPAKKTGAGAVKKPQPPPPLIPPAKPDLDKKKSTTAASEKPTPQKPGTSATATTAGKPGTTSPSKSPLPPKKLTAAASKAAATAKVDDKTKPAPKTEEKKIEEPSNETQPKKKKIVIPFVLPWESRPAKQNQSGMGAFGTKKEVFRPKGGKPLPTDAPLQSENILTLFAETNKFSTQHGMHAFGAHRFNVVRLENAGKEIDQEKLRLCQGIIPKQSGNNEVPTQSGQTPIGSLRQQVMRVEYRPDMQGKMEKKSEGILTKFGTPNPNCHAGTGVIDKFRKQVPDIAIGARMKKGHDRKTESVLPKFAQVKGLPTPAPITGAGSTGLGPFRQVITPVTGGYSFTSDEIIASKKSMPWATSPILVSQQGTGGFQTRRDVVCHVNELLKEQQKNKKK